MDFNMSLEVNPIIQNESNHSVNRTVIAQAGVITFYNPLFSTENIDR
jgi:hypothetical protein